MKNILVIFLLSFASILSAQSPFLAGEACQTAGNPNLNPDLINPIGKGYCERIKDATTGLWYKQLSVAEGGVAGAFFKAEIDSAKTASRPFLKTGTIYATSNIPVLSTDNVFHEAKVNIGANEATLPFLDSTHFQVQGNVRISGGDSAKFFLSSINDGAFPTVYIDPVNGSDTRHFSLYLNSSVNAFATLQAAILYTNKLNVQRVNINIINTTAIAPLVVTTPLNTFMPRFVILNAIGQFINVVSGTMAAETGSLFRFNGGTYNMIGTSTLLNTRDYATLQFLGNPIFNLNAANLTGAFLLGASTNVLLSGLTFNVSANNQAIFNTVNSSTSIYSAISPNVVQGAFTNTKLINNNGYGLTHVISNNVIGLNLNLNYTGCYIEINGRVIKNKDFLTLGSSSTFDINTSNPQINLNGHALEINNGNIPIRYPSIKRLANDAATQLETPYPLAKGDVYSTLDGVLHIYDAANVATVAANPNTVVNPYGSLIVATAGTTQTITTTVGTIDPVLDITHVKVFLNGRHQIRGLDYTATIVGNTVVCVFPASVTVAERVAFETN